MRVSKLSCSVSRRVHTAKSIGIEGTVTQMPTVAELDIAPQQVKVETSWINHLFKGTTSLKTQEQELIAQILASSDADVLVEPKIAHESRRHWFRSNHQLSVSGNPARYKEFRTATREDIGIINDARYPERNRPVILTQTTQSATLTAPAGSPVSRIAKAMVTRQQKPKYVRKTGYRGFLDGGYFAANNMELQDGFGFTTTHGYQIFQQLFVGLGAGYYQLSVNELLYDKYSDYGDKATFIPVFVSVRSDLLKKRVSPYVEGRVGYEFMDAMGMFISAGAGVSIGHFDLGAEYVRLSGDVQTIGAYRVRVGFSF